VSAVGEIQWQLGSGSVHARVIPLVLPLNVSADARFDVGAGAKCFLVKRGAHRRWRHQQATVTQNLFVYVDQGSVVLRRGLQRVPVEAGFGAFVLPGHLSVDEVPDRVGRSASRWIYFDDRAVAKCLRGMPEVERLVAVGGFVHHQIYPLPPARYGIQYSSQGPDGSLFEILDGLLRQKRAAIYEFLRDGFFARKLGLNLWMEGQILSGLTDQQMMGNYPGGPRRFLSVSKTYSSHAASAWWRRRKMELAAVWIRHGEETVDAVRLRLGYSDPSNFSAEYLLQHGTRPEHERRLRNSGRISGTAVRRLLRPFWLIDPAAERRKLWGIQTDDTALELDQPQGDLDAFWALRSTGLIELFGSRLS
jgi:AraC-like DNA-binding protein